MTEAISFDDLSLRNTAKIQRVCRMLTQKEVADMAGVSQREVELFESNDDHLSPIIKRKLLRAYDLIIEGKNESPLLVSKPTTPHFWLA